MKNYVKYIKVFSIDKKNHIINLESYISLLGLYKELKTLWKTSESHRCYRFPLTAITRHYFIINYPWRIKNNIYIVKKLDDIIEKNGTLII